MNVELVNKSLNVNATLAYLSLSILDHGNHLVHSLFHLLGRFSTWMFLTGRAAVGPNPPVGLDLFDICCD